MKIFALGDTHLSFNENIDKPMDVFGYGWENHTERLEKAWNEVVGEDDYVLIPGDLSWALKLEEALTDIEWIHNLKGKKIISKGNHDLWWSRINYLNTLYDDIVFLQNTSYYIREANVVCCATRGWPYPGAVEYSEHDEKIYRRELIRLRMGLDDARRQVKEARRQLGDADEQAEVSGEQCEQSEGTQRQPEDTRLIVALHYPPSDAKCKETEFTKILEEYGVSDCVYGHLHGAVAFESGPRGMYRGVNYSLVSIDYLGCKPKLIYDSSANVATK
jgi:uncharacterized protein